MKHPWSECGQSHSFMEFVSQPEVTDCLFTALSPYTDWEDLGTKVGPQTATVGSRVLLRHDIRLAE